MIHFIEEYKYKYSINVHFEVKVYINRVELYLLSTVTDECRPVLKNYNTQHAPALRSNQGLRGIGVCAGSVELSPGMKMVSVRMQPCVLSLLLLNVFYSFVSSLYFHIGETEKKCFIEEIPDETMIIGECQR